MLARKRHGRGGSHRTGGTTELMEAVVEREQHVAGLARVESNKGAAGVDDMTVEELECYLKEQWQGLREDMLRAATYRSRSAGRDTKA